VRTFWITLGQIHTHIINGRTVDHNTVLEIEAEDKAEAMRRAYEYFGNRFSIVYTEKPRMEYYPGGIVKVEGGYR
jgi:hypothetical protein